MKTDKFFTVEGILGYFKDWNLDEDSKAYISFHCYRYLFLIKETIKYINKLNIQDRRHKLKILDIGKAYQTEIFRNILPEAVINTLGYGDSRFKSRENEKHFHFNLNDSPYPEKWPLIEEHDLIIMAEVIEHLHTAPLHVLKCIAGYLKNGGYLLIQTPNACSLDKRVAMISGKNPFAQIRLSYSHLGHFREYTIQELLELGIQAGYEPMGYNILNYFNNTSKATFIRSLRNILPGKFRDGITICFKKIDQTEHIIPLNDNEIFSKGWHATERDDLGFFRWGSDHCKIHLRELRRDLELRIFSNFPEIKNKNINITFINEKTKKIIQKAYLDNNYIQTIYLKTRDFDKLDLGILVEPTWKPSLYIRESQDQRALGLGIRGLKLI